MVKGDFSGLTVKQVLVFCKQLSRLFTAGGQFQRLKYGKAKVPSEVDEQGTSSSEIVCCYCRFFCSLRNSISSSAELRLEFSFILCGGVNHMIINMYLNFCLSSSVAGASCFC